LNKINVIQNNIYQILNQAHKANPKLLFDFRYESNRVLIGVGDKEIEIGDKAEGEG